MAPAGLGSRPGHDLPSTPDGASGLASLALPLGVAAPGREGIVPIRPSALPFQFDCAGPLTVEDTAHGTKLRSMLAPPLPRILVAVGAERGIA